MPDLKPVVARSRRYLRGARLMCGLLLLLVLAVAVGIEHGALQRHNEFVGNPNTHLLKVTHGPDEDGQQGPPVNSHTAPSIEHVLTASGNTKGTSVSLVRSLGVGLTDAASPDRSYLVIGVDDGLASALGVPHLDPHTAYFAEGSEPRPSITVGVPRIRTSESGVDSDSTSPMTLRTSATLDPRVLDYVWGAPGDSSGPSAVVVSERTFEHIASTMLQTSWARAVSDYDAGKLPMTPLFDSVWVHVDSLGNVEAVQRALSAAGADVISGTAALDDLDQMLLQASLVAGGVGLTLVITLAAMTVIQWRTYARLARRDMGILRSWHIDARTIAQAYANTAGRALLPGYMIAVGLGAIAAVLLLGPAWGAAAAVVNAIGLAALLIALYLAAARPIMIRTASLPTLELLRNGREFQ